MALTALALVVAAPASLAAQAVEGTPVIEDPADDDGLSPVRLDNPLDPSIQVGPVGVDLGGHEAYPHEAPKGPLPDHLDLREVRLASNGSELTVQIETEHLDEEISRSRYSLTFTTNETGPAREHELTCKVGDHLRHFEGSVRCWFSFQTTERDTTCVPQPCYAEDVRDVEGSVNASADTLDARVPYTWFEGEPGVTLRNFEAQTWRCTSVPTEQLQPFFNGIPDTECGVVDEGTSSDSYTLAPEDPQEPDEQA